MTRKLIILAILLLVSANGFAQSYSRVNPDSIPFAPAVNYGVGISPYSLFCADLDGDSDLDVVVANSANGNISILKNNGDGTFQPKVDYATGGNPVSVFCADLDGDSDLDVVVALYDNLGFLAILKNNGDGTFQPEIHYIAVTKPNSVFCADLDGDGHLDIVTALDSGRYPDYIGCVSVLKNNGDGTFQPKVDYATGMNPYSVFCDDLDGDGDLDLAVANSGWYNISVLKNSGNGTFPSKTDYDAGWQPSGIFCADLDGDGDKDLAVANRGWNNVSVLINNGDGTFQYRVNYSTGNTPSDIFCADLDGDGDKDLAVANLYDGSISLLKNNGDGTFQAAVNYVAGLGAISVFGADLDGDGDMDLAVANNGSNSVSILINLTAHPLSAFLLLTPTDQDSLKNLIHFNWQASLDPDPIDTIRYDLYLSRSIVFDPDSTIIYDSLLDTTFTDSLDSKRWYWKVKAYNKWGNVRWSDQAWSFYVNSRPNPYSLISPLNNDSVKTSTTLNWQTSTDPDNDSVRYDLFFSRSVVFNPDSTVAYDSLLDTAFTANLDTKLWHWKVKAYDKWGAVRWSDQSWSFYVYLSGDVNADIKVTVSDVVYLINFLFKGGPAPKPYRAGEVNCDGYVTVADVVYTVNYLFKGGPKPCQNCP